MCVCVFVCVCDIELAPRDLHTLSLISISASQASGELSYALQPEAHALVHALRGLVRGRTCFSSSQASGELSYALQQRLCSVKPLLRLC